MSPGGTVPSGPVKVNDAPAVEQQVIRSGRSLARGPSPALGGRRVLVAAVTSPDHVLGLLHVVAVGEIGPEIIETYAGALGSMFTLLGVRQRAGEQKYVLARLLDGLADPAERPIELVNAQLDIRIASTATSDPKSSSPGLRDRLTERQREVLDLMLAGLSNAEIAERLVLAVSTVKSHVRAVLRASGAVNRSDAVTRFSRSGT